MSSSQKQLKELIKTARAQGWTVQQTRKGHWWFRPPDPTAGQVLLAGTPSDHRAWRNATAKLRRAGLNI